MPGNDACGGDIVEQDDVLAAFAGAVMADGYGGVPAVDAINYAAKSRAKLEKCDKPKSP